MVDAQLADAFSDRRNIACDAIRQPEQPRRDQGPRGLIPELTLPLSERIGLLQDEYGKL